MPQDPIAQVLTPDKTTQVPGQELHKPGENQAVQEQVQPNYPAWPTSKPGPRTTPSPIGMKPINAIRREQVAEIGYNQETGEPGIADRKPAATGQQLLGKRKERL